jgi:uncharacterized protein
MLFLSSKIYVDDSPIHGRGVFTRELILKDEVIEECHFVKLVETNFTKLDEQIKQIAFFWSIPKEMCHVIVMGYGSIYNHSDLNNANWINDPVKSCLRFYAVRDIQPGEEICTNYKKTNHF